jgi:hypothetical protein
MFFLALSSWMRLRLLLTELKLYGFPTHGLIKTNMRWQNFIFSAVFLKYEVSGMKKLLYWKTFYRGTSQSSLLQGFLAKWPTAVFRVFAYCKTRENVDATERSTSIFRQRVDRVSQRQWSRQVLRKRWTCAMTSRSPDLFPLNLSLWCSVYSRMY